MEVGGKKSIVILGAGLTGLAAAHRLHALGHRVRLFEQTNRTGGAIGTEVTADGWLIERGPNSLLTGSASAATVLIRELGLESESVPASPAARHRYIVRDGRLQPAPLSPPGLLRSRLFSFRAKLRLLRELFTRARVRTTDITLAEFVRSHFGQEFVDYALEPFVSGVYAGNPAKLSARHAFPALWSLEQKHGSLIRGQAALARARRARGETAPGIISFRRGLQVLPDALAARLPAGALSLNARIEALLPGGTKSHPRWSVVWHDGRTAQTEEFDAVISALPAAGLASLRFGPLAERPLAALENIEHPPVASLFLGYRRAQITHPLDGFGVLVPTRESRSVLGIIFSSSLFADRAPAGHVALTVMVGGTRQPDLAALPPEVLLARIQPDLVALLGVSSDPVFFRHAAWRRAIPQYNLGYEQYFEAMAACERAFPGLFIGGQARDGIAMPACIAAGEKLAARAAVS